MSEADQRARKATQEFELRNLLMNHCGKVITPELLEQINKEIAEVLQTWSFECK